MRENPPPASEGVSPPIPAPSPRACGAGLVCSVAAAAAAAALGLNGGGLQALQESGGSKSARPWGDPAEAATRMEEASSGAEKRGRISSPASLQLRGACSVRLRGGRNLRLGHGRRSRRAKRAQRVTGEPWPISGTYAATAAHCLSPSTRRQTGNAPPS